MNKITTTEVIYGVQLGHKYSSHTDVYSPFRSYRKNLINQGYTLLEVLVALTVFAILATITASAMYHAFNTRERVNIQANQLNIIQVAMTLFTRDTEQIVERGIVSNDFHQYPPFIGKTKYLEFTRGGSTNPSAVMRKSTLKRVAYICSGKKLIRRSWENLDAPIRKNYQDKILLNNLEQCSFAYLNMHRHALPEWRVYAVEDAQKMETLPLALQMSLTLSGWGSMSLLFVIPGALYAG